MRKAAKLRALTAEEQAEIRRLATSRKEPHNLMQQLKLIVALLNNPKTYATHATIAVGFRVEQTGINWV